MKGGTGPSTRQTPSSSSALSSQTPSTVTRPSSNGFSKSISNGSRPPSTQSVCRPTSAMDHTDTPTHFSVPASRPASVLEGHSTVDPRPALGKRKGTTSTFTSQHLHPSLFEATEDQSPKEAAGMHGLPMSTCISPSYGNGQSSVARSLREASLSTAMRSLHITDDSLLPSHLDASRCSTPSLIPKLSLPRNPITPIHFTPFKNVKRSASPEKIPFLTRDSQTKAWDTKGRLEDIEHLYSELTEKMTGTMRERNGLEESVDLYKSRSASFPSILSLHNVC